MKKNYIRLLIMSFFITCVLPLDAQVGESGTPPSFIYNLKADNIDHIVIPAPDKAYLLEEDKAASQKEDLLRFAVTLPVDLNMGNSGTWTDLPDGRKVWRLKITSKGAVGIGILYSKFIMPKGAKLFVYNDTHSKVIGAFTYKNNPKREEWANEFIYGDNVIIEYVENGRMTEKPAFHISGISYAYKKMPFIVNPNPEKIGESDPCEVNVNCSPEGDNWQNEKRGVAHMQIKIGANWYLCSGSLVNNTSQDCTPYFLSAFHCGDGATAADRNQWLFSFGYEAPGCTTPTSAGYQAQITGCTLVAEAVNNAGTNSDMLLVQLNSSNFGTYVPYFNGWNRLNVGSPSGVSIHHPAGDIKKISTYTSTLANYGGTHWQVVWSATTNGHGVTEGGSSGSPIFNNNNLIVGTLTGGSSYCTATSSPDIYGKFYFHWDQNGTTSGEQLKPWLDPGNTGATTMTGIDYPCSSAGVIANFVGSPTSVVAGNTVTFTDNSTGSPTSWNWTFNGGTPSTFTGQTPPAITYSTPGLYTVSLTVSDGSTSDTETKIDYIEVIDGSTGGCDTLRYPLSGTPMIYGVTNGGYVAGNNSYGDLAKADFFDSYAPATRIEGAMIWFGVATGTGNFTVAVWDDAGGSPGTIIGSETVSIATIAPDVTNQTYSQITFASPITIPGNFYLGVILPTTSGDTIAVITNDDGETPPNTAWEQWSDNVWYAYDDANSWGMVMTHAISPIVCYDPQTINNTENVKINVYPNPTNDYVNVVSNFSGQKLMITITNMIGEVVDTYTFNDFRAGTHKIDMSGFDAGVYYLNINADNVTKTEKITLMK